jgi:hypothetical protein
MLTKPASKPSLQVYEINPVNVFPVVTGPVASLLYAVGDGRSAPVALFATEKDARAFAESK